MNNLRKAGNRFLLGAATLAMISEGISEVGCDNSTAYANPATRTATQKEDPRETLERMIKYRLDELHLSYGSGNNIDIKRDYELGDGQTADVAILYKGEPVEVFDIRGVGHNIYNGTGRYAFRLNGNVLSYVPPGFPVNSSDKTNWSRLEWYYYEGVRKATALVEECERQHKETPRPTSTPSPTPIPTRTPTPTPQPTRTPYSTPTPTPQPQGDINIVQEMTAYLQGQGANKVLINEPIHHQRYSGNAVADVLAIFSQNDDNHIVIEFQDKNVGNVSNFFRDGDNETILDLMNGSVFRSSRGQPAYFDKFVSPSAAYFVSHKQEFENFKRNAVQRHRPVSNASQRPYVSDQGRPMSYPTQQNTFIIQVGPQIQYPVRRFPFPCPQGRRVISF